MSTLAFRFVLIALTFFVSASLRAQNDNKFIEKVRGELTSLSSTKDKLSDAFFEQSEKVCGQWTPPNFALQAPLLFAQMRTCLARSAMHQKRSDRGERIRSALAAIDAAAKGRKRRALKAEVLFYAATNQEALNVKTLFCGAELGLKAMHTFESEMLQRTLSERVARFEQVVALRVPKWSAMALYEVTRIYDGLDIHVREVAPEQFRFVEIDDPLRLEGFSPEQALKSTSVLNADWTREIIRVYSSLSNNKALSPKVREDIRERIEAAQKRVTLFSKNAQSTLPDPRAGALRFFGDRFQKLKDDGTFEDINTDVARNEAKSIILSGVDTNAFADALLAYALGTKSVVDLASLENALKSKKERVRLAALAAMVAAPQKVMRASLIAHYKTMAGEKERPFSNLQGALYGEREWTLRALRSIAKTHRNEGLQISYANALPLEERAWILSELADSRMGGRFQEIYNAQGGRARAIAIYGAYLSSGDRMSWMARAGHPDIAGCAARNVRQQIESKKP